MRPGSPVLSDPCPRYWRCCLCCAVTVHLCLSGVVAPKPLALQLSLGSRKSFSLVTFLTRKRLDEQKDRSPDLLIAHPLPQVPGCPFSGVKSPHLCMRLKALQWRCCSPQVGRKALKQLFFQSHGPQQQHSILHIKVLTHQVWTRSQAPWFCHPSLPQRNTRFILSGSSSSFFHRTERMEKILSSLSMHGWILPIRTCFYSSHTFVTPSMKDLIDWDALYVYRMKW